MILVLLELIPFTNTPRVDEAAPDGKYLVTVKLPKSTPDESHEIVVKSITSENGSYPPAATALVELDS